MRILALDLGDVWVGTAVSDPLGIVCRPFKTVKRKELATFLRTTIAEQAITTILVGMPSGERGQDTEQTKKTRVFVESCEREFSQVRWEVLDEYLTSQLASVHQKTVKGQKLSSQSKLESHSIAAAFLLRDYLYSRRPLDSDDFVSID